MRALILLLSLAVIGLAVSILLYVDARGEFTQRTGDLFHIGGLIADAEGGESAWYRESSSGRVTEFRVVQAPQLPAFAVPLKQIQRRLMDSRGRPYDGPLGTVTYDHRLTEHGFLPLTAPEAPEALDRVWVVRSIRPDRITVGAQTGAPERDCWRIDLIDPALPDGRDTVVAWVSAEIPVFGLLKWKRAGETWEFMRGTTGAGGTR